MNHVATISAETATVSRTFRLPLVSEFENPKTLDVPAPPDVWYALPDRFFDGLRTAAQFRGMELHCPSDWKARVHFDNGNLYATDGAALIEYDAGPSDAPYLCLSKGVIALLKAFGPPREVAVERRADGYQVTHYRWDGKRLSIPFFFRMAPIDKVRAMLDAYDWTDLHPVSAHWKDQIAGHFNFKMARNNRGYSGHGLIYVSTDRIVGGFFDDDHTTELRIDTHAEMDVSLKKDDLLRVLKVADEIKFIHQEDQHRLLFRGQHLRGILVAHRPKDPIPELAS